MNLSSTTIASIDREKSDVLDAIALLYKSIGERTYSEYMSPWGMRVDLPYTHYKKLAMFNSISFEYLKPLLKFTRLRDDIINVICRIAYLNPSRETFYSLISLYREFPELRKEILSIIGFVFRKQGNKTVFISDILHFLKESSTSDLVDIIKVIGYIYEKTSSFKLAEILFKLADQKNNAIMRAIVQTITMIFESSAPLIDRYYRKIADINPSVAEIIIRAVGIFQMNNFYAYYRDSKIRCLFLNCLLRGNTRLRAQTIIALGYMFRKSSSREIAFLIGRFVGKNKLVDIAIARAIRLIFTNNYNKTAKKILLSLLKSRDPQVLAETVYSLGVVHENIYDEEVLYELEKSYTPILDSVFDRTFLRICKNNYKKIKIKIAVFGPNDIMSSLTRIIGEKTRYTKYPDGNIFLGIKRYFYYLPRLGAVSIDFLFWLFPKKGDIYKRYIRDAQIGIILFDKSDTNTFINIYDWIKYFWKIAGVKPIVLGGYSNGNITKIPDNIGEKYAKKLSESANIPAIYISENKNMPAKETLKKILSLLLKHYIIKIKNKKPSYP